jgi:hypothetical protein
MRNFDEPSDRIIGAAVEFLGGLGPRRAQSRRGQNLADTRNFKTREHAIRRITTERSLAIG